MYKNVCYISPTIQDSVTVTIESE